MLARSRLARQGSLRVGRREAEDVLRPDALTICFARRFAGAAASPVGVVRSVGIVSSTVAPSSSSRSEGIAFA